MPRNPTDIGSTPENIRILEIKNPFAGDMGIQVITPRGVHHPLRSACATTGIENE